MFSRVFLLNACVVKHARLSSMFLFDPQTYIREDDSKEFLQMFLSMSTSVGVLEDEFQVLIGALVEDGQLFEEHLQLGDELFSVVVA